MDTAPVDTTSILKTNLFGAWCGVAYCVLLLIGWWVIGGFFPLHRPSAGAEEIAAFFRGDVMKIRLGMVVVMWGSAAFLPFTATMADYVAKVEGRSGPLTKITTMAGYANAMLTFYPPLLWIANTWRSQERSADLIYMINDIAWLQFIGGLALIMPMFVTVAITALNDKSTNPTFPRWTAFASAMTFILFLPDQMLFFFKTGPFAWNGLFGFWVPLSVFCGWFLLLAFLIRRSILADLHQRRGSTAAYAGMVPAARSHSS
jgi:hypothetical protein